MRLEALVAQSVPPTTTRSTLLERNSVNTIEPPDNTIDAFIVWFRESAGRLRHEPIDVVADEVGDRLLGVDGQLGVEVADDDEGPREMIVTSFSEPRLFPTVRRIADSLGDVPGWKLVALKPPRGFSFTLSIGEQSLDAEDLRFRPIPEIPVGIELTGPRWLAESLSDGAETDELAWLTVETGVGEELAGRLEHVEFSREIRERSRPITELAAYILANSEN